MKSSIRYPLIAILTLLLSIGALSQSRPTGQDPASDPQDEVLRVNTTLVGVPVTVTDRDGRRLTDLKQQDFHIYEDGVEQQVQFFATGQTPVTVLLLFDRHVIGNHQLFIKDHREIAARFIKNLRAGDRVIIARTGHGVTDIFEVTADGQMQKQNLKPKWNLSTAIHDAVSMVIKRMNAIPGRKAILFFSDGTLGYNQEITMNLGSGSLISERKIEQFEKSDEASTAREAEESDQPIYTLVYDTLSDVVKNDLPPWDRGGWKKLNARMRAEHRAGAEYMLMLAKKSGARGYAANDARGLDQLFTAIADEISQQYTLGYYPKDQSLNGTTHGIKVTVDRSDVEVRARSSYVRARPKK